MPKFEEALNREAETIKRPPPIPQGHYIMRVTKMPDPPEEMNTRVGAMEVIRINVAVVSPGDDIDPQDLADYGGEVAGAPARIDFMFSNEDQMRFDQTLNRLKQFCGHCGVDVTTGTPGAWLREIPNAQFLGQVSHRLDPNDSENVFIEVRRTAPVE